MAQDLRKMFREDDDLKSTKLQEGHRARFAARLEEALPQKKAKPGFILLKVAAVLVVALGIGFAFFTPPNDPVLEPGNEVVESPVHEDVQEVEDEAIAEEDTPVEAGEPVNTVTAENNIRLSDVSPEFKKVENYYLASLNFELAKLEITEENKALLDSFMEQLSGLEEEYQRLNAEIMAIGANEETVEAMIRNLQLRLELLYKVKNKIKEIKQVKNENHENYKA